MNEITITVTMARDGSINVSGPLSNPVLCYGLLESGKDAVRRFAAEATERRIVEAPAETLRLLPNVEG